MTSYLIHILRSHNNLIRINLIQINLGPVHINLTLSVKFKTLTKTLFGFRKGQNITSQNIHLT